MHRGRFISNRRRFYPQCRRLVGYKAQPMIYQKGDERILGGGNFVEKILNAANETMKKK
jgi:hypothetical protein